jgi:hypothetical protein
MKKTFYRFKRKLFLIGLPIVLLLGGVRVSAQFTYDIVQDKPNNGQLKRMVFIKWDDWEPSTKTILGIPLNAKGFAFWKVLNNKYYTGEDRRPYRLDGGPFIKNYADLNVQERSDKKITDTTEKIRNTHAATYLNMSGGTADAAYNIYFKKKFGDIYSAFDEFLSGMQREYPIAYDACMKSAYFKTFQEYLDITKDRVKANHEAFVDKGVRLEAYINIYKELDEKYKVISRYMAGQVQLSRLPTQKQIKQSGEVPVFNKDKEIVKHILGSYKF